MKNVVQIKQCNNPEKPPDYTNHESSPELTRQLQKREGTMLAGLLDIRKTETKSINSAWNAYHEYASWLRDNAHHLKHSNCFNPRALSANLMLAEHLLGKEKTMKEGSIEISSKEKILNERPRKLPNKQNNIYLISPAPLPIGGQGYNRIMPPRSLLIAHKSLSNHEDNQDFYMLAAEGLSLTQEETTTSVHLSNPINPSILNIDSETGESEVLCTISAPLERQDMQLEDIPCEVVTYQANGK